MLESSSSSDELSAEDETPIETGKNMNNTLYQERIKGTLDISSF